MCGLYGAAGPHIDPLIVADLAVLAGRRGPHGWGLASFGPDGELLALARRRGLVDRATITRLLEDDRPAAVLGHCRLATTGADLADTDAYHPLLAGRYAVAHNGTVRNHAALVERYDLEPRTTTDSEVIALLADQAPPGHGIPWALYRLSDTSPHALLAYGDGSLWAARRPTPDLPGHPLYVLRDDETVYVCSWQPDSSWTILPDDTCTHWRTRCPSTS